MIQVVVGAPGAFTDWCAHAAAGLLRGSGQEATIAGVGRLEEVGWCALCNPTPALVCFAIAVDDALAHALAGAAHGPIIAEADPRSAMLLCLGQHDISATDAFQRVLTAAVAMRELGARPGALRLTPQACAADPLAALAALAAHMGLSLTAEATNAVAAATQPSLQAALAAGADSAAVKAATADRSGDNRLATAMAGVLADYAQGGDVVRADAALFLEGVPPHRTLSDPIDVTGAARFLFVGGYLPLLPGAWEAEALIDVSGAACDGIYLVELVLHGGGAAHVAAYQRLTLAVPGRNRITLGFSVASIMMRAELRLRSERAMFDGMVSLEGVRFQRQAITAV